MRKIHNLIGQVAPSDSNVLVLGESGTGKEMVARHIHELSGRSAHAFVPVNCGAIPAELLESELFGHEKGAFTGALSMRLGRFEFAEGGTLFLDEIGDMSLQMQVKLLRVLQERSFERVGSNRTIRCNVRIIAATHRDLEAAMAAGRFREDLFYRLNVFPIQIPPLRDRLEDLPLLIEHLLERQQKSSGRRVLLAKDALNCLMRCKWPGNVRELSNLLERLGILYPDQTVVAADLPDRYRVIDSSEWFGSGVRIESEPVTAVVEPAESTRLPSGGLDLKDHLSAIELGLIRKAMEEADGTVAEAARLLRMRRTTLVEKLRKYRLNA
jgi:sigma-54 specific flagellar transcriptional regulator A